MECRSVHGPAPQICSMLPSSCLSFSVSHLAVTPSPFSWYIQSPPLPLHPAGEARPPLTVVLINNGGGGIFSFLPIAEALPEEVFTPLWATPQHVDLGGERTSGVCAMGRAGPSLCFCLPCACIAQANRSLSPYAPPPKAANAPRYRSSP